jgi:hypothetical protein
MVLADVHTIPDIVGDIDAASVVATRELENGWGRNND